MPFIFVFVYLFISLWKSTDFAPAVLQELGGAVTSRGKFKLQYICDLEDVH